MVAQILLHHLARDNNPPLRTKPDDAKPDEPGAEEPNAEKSDAKDPAADKVDAAGADAPRADLANSDADMQDVQNLDVEMAPPENSDADRSPPDVLEPLEESSDNPSTETSAVTPDKMILFSAFPESNHLIIAILTLLGVPADQILEVNGNLALPKRMIQLQKFNDPKGPRILIISGVGMVGLNLQCGSIMIILVRSPFPIMYPYLPHPSGHLVVCAERPPTHWPNVAPWSIKDCACLSHHCQEDT